MSFETFISRRYLKIKKKQAFISLITLLSIAGVTVGVMAMIIVISVMSGFENDLKSRILGIESHLIVSPVSHGPPDHGELVQNIAEISGVSAATPFISAQTMIRSTAGISGALLKGIDPETAGEVFNILSNMQLTQLLSLKDRVKETENGIVLGRALASNLSVLKGDFVYVLSPRGIIAPIGHVPAMRRFQVTGFFETGMYEYDGSLAFIHLEAAQNIMRMQNEITGIDVRLNDIYQVKNIKKKALSRLGDRFEARDWMEMNRNLFSALKLEKTVMFIILILIVLVAAFNIAGTLIMMVMEKKQDIAIMKAMGASNNSIRKIFIYKGTAIGLIGTVIGVFSGVTLCWLLKHYKFVELPGNIYYITTLPVQMEVFNIALIAMAALAICYLATLYPSRQASSLDPVEAIRYG